MLWLLIEMGRRDEKLRRAKENKALRIAKQRKEIKRRQAKEARRCAK